MKLRLLTILILFIGFTSKALSTNRNAEKQCGYQENCLTSHDESESNAKTEHDTTKGQILLHLSFPYINNFHLNPLNEETKTNTGFMGYSVGLDYCYKSNQYMTFSFSQIQDFFLPIAFVDKGDEYELMSSYVFSLTNNYKINRLSLGYGMIFSKNSWELRNLSWNENSSSREPVKKSNYALGLSFSSYYQLAPSFYLGLIYRPTFLRINSDPTLKYEHTISIDIAWKIKLKK